MSMPDNNHREIEEQVLGIWRNVLRIETIDLNHTFVDLGGDSLAAMLCISRVRAAFQVELSVDDFMANDATVASHTSQIEKIRNHTDP
jgi:acyl carrier protein